MNIKQQIACINRLPGVHRLAMIDLESEWNRDVWRSVEKEWSNEEVAAAATQAPQSLPKRTCATQSV